LVGPPAAASHGPPDEYDTLAPHSIVLQSRHERLLMQDPAKRRLWLFVAAISLVVAAAIFRSWWELAHR
jgi:hypothetical protein